jgi:hypothetical protein
MRPLRGLRQNGKPCKVEVTYGEYLQTTIYMPIAMSRCCIWQKGDPSSIVGQLSGSALALFLWQAWEARCVAQVWTRRCWEIYK